MSPRNTIPENMSPGKTVYVPRIVVNVVVDDQEVRNMLPFSFRDKRNVDCFTPSQEFTKNHQYLVDEGEKMMKGVGVRLMVVVALLATITFAGASYLMLRNDFAYSVYMIFSCISFLLASASIVNILSLLSSRYAQHDFLTSLPNK
nr:ankyrin repeat-containing domain, PGG domain protein [Tanacetum cinerariifolium]